MSISLAQYSWSIPIVVKSVECKVEGLSFQNELIRANYILSSGPMIIELPKLIEFPNCGEPREVYLIYIDEILSDVENDIILGAIQLDEKANNVKISSADTRLANKSVELRIKVSQNITNADVSTSLVVRFIGVRTNQIL